MFFEVLSFLPNCRFVLPIGQFRPTSGAMAGREYLLEIPPQLRRGVLSRPEIRKGGTLVRECSPLTVLAQRSPIFYFVFPTQCNFG